MHRLKHEGLLEAPEIKDPARYIYELCFKIMSFSKFYNKPEEFAMHHYKYVLCGKCKAPYFFGAHDCAQVCFSGSGEREGVRHVEKHALRKRRHRKVGGIAQTIDPNPFLATQPGRTKTRKFSLWRLFSHCWHRELPTPWQRIHRIQMSVLLLTRCLVLVSLSHHFSFKFSFGNTHFCDVCHQNWGGMPKENFPNCPVGPGCKQLPDGPCPMGLKKHDHPNTGEEFSMGCWMCFSLND